MWQYCLVVLCILIILLIYLCFSRNGKSVHGLWKSDEYHLFIEDTINPCKKISIMDSNDKASRGKMMLFPMNTSQDKEKYICHFQCKKSINLPKCSVIVIDNIKEMLLIGDKEFVKI